MAKILCGTHCVNEDEPCLGLFEMDTQSPGSHGFHRYQIMYVMRGDRPAEFRRDLGRTEKFKGVDQIRIPGGVYNDLTDKYEVVHTVGELMEIASKLRIKKTWDKRELTQMQNIRET